MWVEEAKRERSRGRTVSDRLSRVSPAQVGDGDTWGGLVPCRALTNK